MAPVHSVRENLGTVHVLMPPTGTPYTISRNIAGTPPPISTMYLYVLCQWLITGNNTPKWPATIALDTKNDDFSQIHDRKTLRKMPGLRLI